jgi:hypothetical protein
MSKAVDTSPRVRHSVVKYFFTTGAPRKLEAKKVCADNKLLEDSVIRNFRITAADGKTCDTEH